MPKLPQNMVRRKGRSGFYFRKKINGRTTMVALGMDFTEAKNQLRKLQGQGDRLLRDVRVKDAAAQWVRSYLPTARQPNGQKLGATRMEKYLLPFMGNILLQRVGKENLRSYRLHLESRGIKPLTVVHVLAEARCFFNWCEESDLLDRSPFPRRIMPRIQQSSPDRLSDEEADLLRALPDPHGFVCRLGLGTGLRWGELTQAQASDVSQKFLVVRHKTKSGKIRSVPLEPQLLAEVRMHVGQLVPFARLSPGSFAKAVRRLSGIEGFHGHQMRHTFACQWLERGGSLAALQQILGHASIVTTQRYARLSDELVMRESERLQSHGATIGVASNS